MVSRASSLVTATALGAALAVTVGCHAARPASPRLARESIPVPSISRDVHSYARPEEVRVTHVSLALTPDFTTQVLRGTARLLLARRPGATKLVLDSRGLVLDKVVDETGALLSFELGVSDPILGEPLVIALNEKSREVILTYRTQPTAPALQWLEPTQTAGGKLPYLFTQGQAILTRSWIPLQDSPGIRITYDAVIHAPEPLVAVMSAEHSGPPEPAAGGTRSFRFQMTQPVPPYLIALAVGELAFRPLGPRSGVYAEPSVVETAAAELSDVEEMMRVAEALYGPYRWGRYDVLLLPPAFPFGGMENPRLTFLSPTVLAGDKSLVGTVAHELAHSWSGNLVTNATWSDFWLNEGFTVYLEGRITERLFGSERASATNVLGLADLKTELQELGPTSDATRLCRPLSGQDPDDGITAIPYEKGSLFLRMLEQAVGRQRLDDFLRRYFDEHAFSSMTTARWLEKVRRDLLNADARLAEPLELDAWAYGPGLPANAPRAHSALLEQVERDAKAFAGGAPLETLRTASYDPFAWLHFLGQLPQDLPASKMEALDAHRGFSVTGNRELRFTWLKLVISTRFVPAFGSLEEHLLSQGRRRLVLPLYRELARTDWGRTLAGTVYAKARSRYHALTRSAVDEVLQAPSAKRR